MHNSILLLQKWEREETFFKRYLCPLFPKLRYAHSCHVILFLLKTKCISQDKHSISLSPPPIPSLLPLPKSAKEGLSLFPNQEERLGVWWGREGSPQKKSLYPRTPSKFKFNKNICFGLWTHDKLFVKINWNFLWSLFSFTWKGKISKGMCGKKKKL